MINRLNKELKDLTILTLYLGWMAIAHLIKDESLNSPENYPFKTTFFQFQTKIFHSNIGEDGLLCEDKIETKEKWQPTKTVKYLLKLIYKILRQVNPYDFHNMEAMNMYREDKNKFEEFARIQTKKHAT
ncbi:unnamed protein product [Paramecium pentaurelia]|uniref:UBC core domain-containing protein n=1 Tax=Paramecium pentaurelia TaxID=43138 RepID=A0A8S1Y4W6_9CILI|nr:unnamed protein product [Paramecium pentaurelia]